MKKLRIFVFMMLFFACQSLYAQNFQNVSVLSLDGDGDYVDVPDSAGLDITNQITLEVWIKFQAGGTQNNPRIICKEPDFRGYELHLTSNSARFALRLDEVKRLPTPTTR